MKKSLEDYKEMVVKPQFDWIKIHWKSVTKFIKTVKRGFGKRSPEILLGIGIASGITATVLAVKATPKALELLTEKRYSSFRIFNSEKRECNEQCL